MATSTVTSTMTAEYVNPVISATKDVFGMMLNCTPKRSGLQLKGEDTPSHDVSAVISVTGEKSRGTIILSFSKSVAIQALERMLGNKETEINHQVCDAVGELANMIAGAAKAQLAHLDLSIGIPNIVVGPNHRVVYSSEMQPICILFNSEIGDFLIEVGFVHTGW